MLYIGKYCKKGGDKMSVLFDLLTSSDYINIKCNIAVARRLGLRAALLLAVLVDEHKQLKKSGKLKDGWFPSTIKEIQNKTTLNYYAQLKNIKILAEAGLLEHKIVGMRRQRLIKLNIPKIFEIYGETVK